MIIKALRRFGVDGKSYMPGQIYEVDELRVNRTYYQVVSASPVKSKPAAYPKKRTANMKSGQVKKVVVR